MKLDFTKNTSRNFVSNSWDDLPTYQECIRAIRRAGAQTPSTTSQHVHVGAADLTPQQITNLVRSFYKQEKLIHKAFGTLESRLNRYTQPCDRAFVDRIIARKPKTMRELNEAWFGEYRPTFQHYDSHRYYVEYGIMLSSRPNERVFKNDLPFQSGHTK